LTAVPEELNAQDIYRKVRISGTITAKLVEREVYAYPGDYSGSIRHALSMPGAAGRVIDLDSAVIEVVEDEVLAVYYNANTMHCALSAEIEAPNAAAGDDPHFDDEGHPDEDGEDRSLRAVSRRRQAT
jgi:hypothetical protein